MSHKNPIRNVLKKIPPVYWLAGWVNYSKFHKRLNAANAAYAMDEKKITPPPMLRYRVHRALDEKSYLVSGEYLSDVILEQIKAANTSMIELKVLDFACGPGRVATQIKDKLGNCELYGSDIDEEAIKWASTNKTDTAQFSVNKEKPPTKYDDNFFDVIYSISLFTHLDENYQNDWLKEIRRILKPGGIFITTVHGSFCRDTCSPEELNLLASRGFAFRIDHVGRFKIDGLPDFYQTTFHTKYYVEKNWSAYFEVENYLEGGVHGHHDLITLRKP